jgi:hypothetical protein
MEVHRLEVKMLSSHALSQYPIVERVPMARILSRGSFALFDKDLAHLRNSQHAKRHVIGKNLSQI